MKRDLSAVLERHAKALLRHARRARRGNPDAIHQARVASRRLREALPVALEASPAARRLDCSTDVRRVTRLLGTLRELDVTLRELEAEAARYGWPSAAVTPLREYLMKERARRLRVARAKLERLDLETVGERSRALARECEGRGAAWQVHLGTRLRKRARRFRAALRDVGTLYVPEPLHAVRIAGKKLRYTLELARASIGAPVGRDIASLERLQDLLGRLRDLQVLQEYVRAAATGAEDPAASSSLDGIQRELDGECRVLHATFLGRVERLAALADRAGRRAPTLVAAGRPLRLVHPRASVRRTPRTATA
jgi:CHAD domain-containing protein